MIVTYVCPECGKTRYFTSKRKEEVRCEVCNAVLESKTSNISSSIMTNEEARYLGDEALFNTVGKQISEKRSKHFASKN